LIQPHLYATTGFIPDEIKDKYENADWNGRKKDVYKDDAKWKKRPINMDGEPLTGIPLDGSAGEQWDEDDLRSRAIDLHQAEGFAAFLGLLGATRLFGKLP